MTQHAVIEQIEKAIERRESLKEVTNALRLVNGVGDGLAGLILEQYRDHCVAQIFDPEWLSRKKLLTDYVRNRLGGKYFIVKDRTASAKPDGFRPQTWIADAAPQTVVTENSLRFAVDLNDTLNTGLFLDMRWNRSVVGHKSAGRKVLNCFSYTCSFGVYCRFGQAAEVTNVDISQKALDRGKVNYKLNRIKPGPNEFVHADAMRYLERAAKINNRFGMIILDPPSFARFEGRAFSVKKDLQCLVERAAEVLDPGGIMLISTNLSELTYDDILDMAAVVGRKRRVKKVDRLGQDLDFYGSGLMPESYLVAGLVEVEKKQTPA